MYRKTLNFLFVTLIAISSVKTFCWDMYSFDKNLFVGNILFPQTITKIPQISLYRRGLKIQAETENACKKVQFTISEDKECKRFYVLITPYLQPQIEDNTVKCLKIEAAQSYKLYEIKLFVTQDTRATSTFTKNTQKSKESYFWQIRERKIREDRAIPDDALIVIFNPDYVEKLEGGNDLELPKIIIKNNVLELAGSEKKLQAEADELLMASLDLNILHTKPTSEIKPEYKKKLVIAMSNSG
ncbi:hypothetical protein ACFLYU_03135 [Candidatus Dependentiae bacterium]